MCAYFEVYICKIYICLIWGYTRVGFSCISAYFSRVKITSHQSGSDHYVSWFIKRLYCLVMHTHRWRKRLLGKNLNIYIEFRVLLALVVALLNSTGGLEALYVFLSGVGFAIFVIFILGPLYRKLCHKTNSFQDGPSPVLMTVTLLLVLSCAFVTDILGIHPIFGGFIAGLIIPHEHDLSIKITEKIEDMVNIVFLPLVSLHIYLY